MSGRYTYFSALSYRLFTSVTLVTYIYQSRTYISQATLPPFPLKIPLHNLSAVFISTAFFVCTFCFKLFFLFILTAWEKKFLLWSVHCSENIVAPSLQTVNLISFVWYVYLYLWALEKKQWPQHKGEMGREREREGWITWHEIFCTCYCVWGKGWLYEYYMR